MEGFALRDRNDLCLCGSGRKYKRCCLPREHVFVEDRQLGNALLDVMWTALKVGEIRPSVEALWQRYWPGEPPIPLNDCLESRVINPELAQDSLGFVDWAVHDAPLENVPRSVRPQSAPGQAVVTLPDIVETTQVWDFAQMSDSARRVFDAWRASFLSAFQVLRTDQERTVSVRDVFTDETFEVWDASLASTSEPGALLIVRLVPHGGVYEVSGAGWGLTWAEVEPLRRWGEVQLERLREFEMDADWRRLWRVRGGLLHHYVVERRLHPLRPDLYTSTGEPVMLCKAQWRVRDRTGLTLALDAVEEFRKDEGGSWTWHPKPGDDRWEQRKPGRPATKAAPEEGWLPGGPSLGTLTLEDGDAGPTLTFECMSELRLKHGRALITGATGTALEFIREERRTVEEAMADRLSGEGGPRTEPNIPSEEAREALASFMADYEQRWLTHSLPALDGKTPRQAVASADPGLRRKLEDLLLTMEAQERQLAKSQDGTWAGMSTERVRRLLGKRSEVR